MKKPNAFMGVILYSLVCSNISYSQGLLNNYSTNFLLQNPLNPHSFIEKGSSSKSTSLGITYSDNFQIQDISPIGFYLKFENKLNSGIIAYSQFGNNLFAQHKISLRYRISLNPKINVSSTFKFQFIKQHNKFYSAQVNGDILLNVKLNKRFISGVHFSNFLSPTSISANAYSRVKLDNSFDLDVNLAFSNKQLTSFLLIQYSKPKLKVYVGVSSSQLKFLMGLRIKIMRMKYGISSAYSSPLGLRNELTGLMSWVKK